MTQAYCIKCRKMVEIQNPQQVALKNGRPAVRGTCPETGTAVLRMGGL